MTQTDFAEKIGLSRSHIAQAEAGLCNAKFTDKTIKLICEKCRVNENWLRTGEGEMFAEKDDDKILADFLADIINEPDDSYKKRFIAALAKMTPDDWRTLYAAIQIFNVKGNIDDNEN